MKVACVVVALVLLCGMLGVQQAQVTQEPSSESAKTKFEAFSAKDGVLMLKEVYTLSSPATKHGSAEAKVVRKADVRGNVAVIALVLSYKGTERFDREAAEVLDEDEVASLASALEYIRLNRRKMIDAAKTYTEATYSSRGGFQTGLYFGSGTVGDYMKIGHETVFLESLDAIENVVKEAGSKIKELRQ